jgi:GNAT superfamily N-acetyltransferase
VTIDTPDASAVAAAYDRWAESYDTDPNQTRALAAAVLRQGALASYLRNLSQLPSWVALLGPRVVGAITLEQHFPSSFEVHFMAVRPERHRHGIGRTLLHHLELEARAQGGRWLHVKTLAPSHPDPYYARTRAFYQAMGFTPLFEITALWGPENPTVVLVKPL